MREAYLCSGNDPNLKARSGRNGRIGPSERVASARQIETGEFAGLALRRSAMLDIAREVRAVVEVIARAAVTDDRLEDGRRRYVVGGEGIGDDLVRDGLGGGRESR